MRPTGIFGVTDSCPVPSEFLCGWFDAQDPNAAFTKALLELADPQDPRMQRIKDLEIHHRLLEAGVLIAPASGCGPAAWRIYDHEAAQRIIAEFEAQRAASYAKLCLKLYGY